MSGLCPFNAVLNKGDSKASPFNSRLIRFSKGTLTTASCPFDAAYERGVAQVIFALDMSLIFEQDLDNGIMSIS